MSEYTLFWIILAVTLGIIEASTVNLVTVWFALGSVAAFFVAIFSDSLILQIGVFTAVALITLVLTRPLAKKLLKDKKIATNADRFIGERAVVIEDIDTISGSGKIKALGQVWSAKPETDSKIECGEKVIINKIEGVKVVVSKAE